MQKVNDLVSIIIPTYKNRGKLAASVKSALEQDYKEKEIIVVDDNNPDTEERLLTEKVMSQFVNESCVYYIQHAVNRNGASARNTGFRASRGGYIAFLDDDDTFLPGKLTKQVAYLKEHAEYQAVYCLAIRRGKPVATVPYKGDVSKELLMMRTSMFTPTLMFRRDSLEVIHGFDESYRRHQDYELLLRFFQSGSKIGCVEEILTEIGSNQGENILSADKSLQLKMNFLKTFEDYIIYYDKQNPGFCNYVYGKHFTALCLSYLKEKSWGKSIKWMCKAFRHSPTVFCAIVFHSIAFHVNKKR